MNLANSNSGCLTKPFSLVHRENDAEEMWYLHMEVVEVGLEETSSGHESLKTKDSFD